MAERVDAAQPLQRRCRAPPRARALAAVAPTASEGSMDVYVRHSKSTHDRLSLLPCRFTLVVRERSHYKRMRQFLHMSAVSEDL